MNNEPFVTLIDTTAQTQFVVKKNTLWVKEVFCLLLLLFSRFLSLIVNFTYDLLRKSKDLLVRVLSVFSSRDNKKLYQ